MTQFDQQGFNQQQPYRVVVQLPNVTEIDAKPSAILNTLLIDPLCHIMNQNSWLQLFYGFVVQSFTGHKEHRMLFLTTVIPGANIWLQMYLDRYTRDCAWAIFTTSVNIIFKYVIYFKCQSWPYLRSCKAVQS